MPIFTPLGAMVIRGCGAVLGRVGGVRTFSTIRGASGPIRYNPQAPGAAKPTRRESTEDAGVSHSRPLQRWKRAPKTDEEWGLRKTQEQKRYWDRQEEVGKEVAEEDQSFASTEMQRLKAEMKLRDSSIKSSAPISHRRERIHPVAEEEQTLSAETSSSRSKHDKQDASSPSSPPKLLRAQEEAVPTPADLESIPVAKNQTFGEGLFYGDGRKFESLNSESSNWNRGPQALKKKNPLQSSGLFYGDGRKFEGLLPDATALFEDPFIAAEDKLFETADTEEDKTIAKEKQGAKNYALRLLAIAPQTAHKLRQKLIGRNVSASVIDSTIVDLQRWCSSLRNPFLLFFPCLLNHVFIIVLFSPLTRSMAHWYNFILLLLGSGLQSDLEYAEAFARSRWRSSLWGPQRLKQELRQRGVCAEDIETALEKVFNSTDVLHEDGDLEDNGGRWGMTKEASEHLLEKARLQWGRGGSISAEARKRRMGGWLQRRGFNWSITSQILKSLESQEREFG